MKHPQQSEAAPTAAVETAPEVSGRAEPNPEQWVDAYGDYLLSYALGRVRNRARAEDLVQETFLAALRGKTRFAGRSAERTWLVGILRNKILEYFRTAFRERPFSDLEFYAEEESEQFVAAGLRRGSWTEESAPVDWSAQQTESLDQEEFWKTFRNCADKLPVQVARVFLMREVDEIESRTICELMHISESNLWVILHRARMALRRCLQANWFGK